MQGRYVQRADYSRLQNYLRLDVKTPSYSLVVELEQINIIM